MNKVLEQYFVDKYPKIFVDMYGPPDKTAMHWGIACGDGWFFVLDNLCRQIQSRIDHREKMLACGCECAGVVDSKIPQVVAAQVKEKFGALRFYHDGGDEYIKGCVHMAEELSWHICENCGLMNEDVGHVETGWIQSLCSKCASEYGKEIKPNDDLIKLWTKMLLTRSNKNRSWRGIDELTKVDFGLPKKKNTKPNKKKE